jgi:hypothetical protein
VAVIALGHNGIGLGHVSRLISLCERLASAGEKPVLLAEGSSYCVIPHDFPSASLSKVGDQSPRVRSEIGRALSALALISSPSVVVEDTHPLALNFARSISRILVVRPIEWRELKKLKEASDKFHIVVIADHPGSPTWPYTNSQTSQISSWRSWFCIGPLHRRASNTEIDDVKKRYGLTSQTRLCVFSMGGGGEHFGANDAVLFCKRARSIGNWVLKRDPKARLVFVGGPLFQRYDLIPQFFTIARSETFMPALFALADVAVIRPGFNSVWECIAGGTPIIPILGTSYIEPMEHRVARLQSSGIAFRHISDCWDSHGRRRVRRRARIAAMRWNRCGATRMLRKIFAKGSELRPDGVEEGPTFVRAPSFDSLKEEESWEVDLQRLREMRCKSVSVRIDDVTTLTDVTKSLVELCGEFGLGVSLEVVPYFTQISRARLLRCKIANELVEVGQHGYSHILRSCHPGPKSEFTFSEVGIEKEIDEIAKGKRILEKNFPKEFRNGFSPPFDGMPSWLGESWAQLGGQYFSVMEARPTGTRIPFVINSVDVWNWAMNRPHSLSHIRKEIISAVARSSHAGLVLHANHFVTTESMEWLRKLLNWLRGACVEFVLPSRCAGLQSLAVVTSPFRRYASVAFS